MTLEGINLQTAALSDLECSVGGAEAGYRMHTVFYGLTNAN